MTIEHLLNEIGITPARLAAMIEVEPALVEAWLSGGVEPPQSVFNFLEQLREIKRLSHLVQCRVPGAH